MIEAIIIIGGLTLSYLVLEIALAIKYQRDLSIRRQEEIDNIINDLVTREKLEEQLKKNR